LGSEHIIRMQRRCHIIINISPIMRQFA
jgi:hypothetical protein